MISSLALNPRGVRELAISFFLVACVSGCAVRTPDPVPLLTAHAHNDYAHGRPLFDALDCGFCSVEADVVLVHDNLMVAHDAKQATPGRTFEALYLDPLLKRVATHGGRVYRDGPGIILLIDFKTDPRLLYPRLRQTLRRYADILTTWHEGRVRPGAVTVVLTGDHPPAAVLMAEGVRYAAIDGKLPDIDSEVSADLMPQISIDWRSEFQWKGVREMPAADRTTLHALVDHVHQRGRTIRLWAAPDQPRAWAELLDAGVDFINTDDLPGLRRFLLDRATTRPCTRTVPADFPPDPGSR